MLSLSCHLPATVVLLHCHSQILSYWPHGILKTHITFVRFQMPPILPSNCTFYSSTFIRCYYFYSLNIPAAIGESNPARRQLLYCRVGIGFHLQIVMNGSVWGVHEPSEYSLLRVFAVRPGIVGICGVKSERYLITFYPAKADI
uniref:Uncharacterized protein n=1 Tax=Sinocyclocheilus anshuiensis TaxID=1608454 RepID=A0A671SKD2_9TELE